jgi:hypothetical protein
MKKQAIIVAGTMSLLMPLAIGIAGPAAAAPTSSAMPSVRGISLQKAMESIQSLDEDTNFRIRTYNLQGWTTQQLSPANWVVCRQSPAAGRNITARTNITLAVNRPWQGC